MTNLPSEEIKSRIDIVDVVSGYIKLQKAGNSFRAVCPFHNENSPSFFVSPDKQIFNCFGCGKGGDMFKFVMEMEGVEFVDALRILAKQAGIELKREDPKVKTEKSELQDICVDSARFFYKNLHSDAGKNALEYLDKRALTKETLDEFKIGYALSSWDSLYNFLTLKGYKADMIEKAGLVLCSTKSGSKKYFDRFRDRIMFPISDANGYIVGFTGRYLTPKENEGKYVNSPHTIIFDKSNILYNLNKAKMNIKKSEFSLVVEGQMDVISCWQDGIQNVVASSGTALTIQQVKLLKRYSNNLKIAFDMDSAGEMATKRGIDIALEEDLNVSIVRVPDGKDPSDFIAAHKGEFKDILERSMPIMDYYFESTIEKYNKNNIDDKKKISEELLLHIKKIKNKVEMYHWLDRLSQVLSIDIKYLEEEMSSINNPVKTFSKSINQPITKQKQQKRDDKFFKSIFSFLIKDESKFSVLEENGFVKFIKEDEEYIREVVSDNMISLFDFFQKYATIRQISEGLKNIDEPQKEILNPIILQSEMIDESIDLGHEIDLCSNKIMESVQKVKINKQNIKISEAERSGDQELLKEHLEQLNKIIKS